MPTALIPEDMISGRTAAEILGIHPTHLDRLGRRGHLTRYTTPLGFLYSRAEVEARRQARAGRGKPGPKPRRLQTA